MTKEIPVLQEVLEILESVPIFSKYHTANGFDPEGYYAAMSKFEERKRKAHTNLKKYIEDIPELETALMNAVKPSYDIEVSCVECGREQITDNGEWLIWCGDKEHAENILKAARHLQKGVKS